MCELGSFRLFVEEGVIIGCQTILKIENANTASFSFYAKSNTTVITEAGNDTNLKEEKGFSP